MSDWSRVEGWTFVNELSQACHFWSVRAEERCRDESFEWGGIELPMLQGDISDMFLASIFRRELLTVPSRTADHQYPGRNRTWSAWTCKLCELICCRWRRVDTTLNVWGFGRVGHKQESGLLGYIWRERGQEWENTRRQILRLGLSETLGSYLVSKKNLKSRNHAETSRTEALPEERSWDEKTCFQALVCYMLLSPHLDQARRSTSPAINQKLLLAIFMWWVSIDVFLGSSIVLTCSAVSASLIWESGKPWEDSSSGSGDVVHWCTLCQRLNICRLSTNALIPMGTYGKSSLI